jgi:hypothetical protein
MPLIVMWHKLATNDPLKNTSSGQFKIRLTFHSHDRDLGGHKKGILEKRMPLLTTQSPRNYGVRSRKNCTGGLVTAKVLVNVPVPLKMPVVLVFHTIGAARFVVASQV